MEKIKNKISIILSFVLIFTSLYSPASLLVTNADSTATAAPKLYEGTSQFEGFLSNWLVDEENGNIYTISSDSDKLVFYDINTLNVKKEFKFTSISDIEIYNGKLYAALEGDKQIAVINMQTGVIEKRINLALAPYRITLAEGKIFYVPRYFKGWEGDQVDFSKIYIYNMADSKESVISPFRSAPSYEYTSWDRFTVNDLKADEQGKRVFVSNEVDDHSRIASISSTDYKILDLGRQSSFKSGDMRIIMHDKDLFYGSNRLDKNDLSKIYGSYGAYIYNVKDNYVFTNRGIYDRESFLKVGQYTEHDGEMGYFGYNNVIIDSKNMLYLYKSTEEPLSKGELSGFLLTQPTYPIGANYDSDQVGTDTKANRLEITKWVVDSDKRLIYAVSKNNDSLMMIGLDDLKLKKQVAVGKAPSNLALYQGKLYVSLSAINQAAVVNPDTFTVEKKVVLKHRPEALAVDGSKLFYMGHDETSSYPDIELYLNVYDMSTDKEAQINIAEISSFNKASISVDGTSHTLYAADSERNYIAAISTIDYKKVGLHRAGGSNNYSTIVTMDGENLIFSREKLDKQNLDSIKGIFAEPIIYTKGNYAFSRKNIYDVNNWEKVGELPFDSDTIYMDSTNQAYMFDRSKNAIKKISVKAAVDSYMEAYNAALSNTYYTVDKYDSSNPGKKLAISKMILDEKNGQIFAVGSMSNKLHVIDMNTLKLKKEVLLGYVPTDVEFYNGKLYVVLPNTKYVTVIDAVNQTLIEKINVSTQPRFIEVDGNKLYYFGDSKVHEYDMLSKTERVAAFYNFTANSDQNYIDSIFMDRDNHILYGYRADAKPASSLYGIDTTVFKPVKLPVKTTNLSEVKNGSAPVFFGNELYNGQTSYNRNDYSIVHPYLGRILHVDDRFVISSYEMYLRENGTKLGDMPVYDENMHVDGKNNVYIVNNYGYSIKKTTIDDILHSLKNKTAAYDALLKGETVEILPFDDISNHWAKNDIVMLAKDKIVNGVDSNSFNPEGAVTRAQFVTMLVRVLGMDSVESTGVIFTDVKENDWYYKSVMAAKKVGLVDGKGSGRFAPNDYITREEIATLAIRALEFRKGTLPASDPNILSAFKDISSISSWAKPNAAKAVGIGLVNGKPGMLFAPRVKTTRAESAVIIKRLLERL